MYVCNKCNDTVMFTEKKGTAIGLYCQTCGAWQKWVGKDEFRVFEYHNNKAIKEKAKKAGNGNYDQTIKVEIPKRLLVELLSHLDKELVISLLE